MLAIPVIHIVDDDASVRTALSRLLALHGYQVAAHGSAGEFLMNRRMDAPGCILLDIHMPGPSGMELHDSLAKEDGPLPVIFLTGHGDIPTSVRAMKTGAVDFLTKPVCQAALLAAVERALALDHGRRDAAYSTDLLRQRFGGLTSRERQVFDFVTEGLLNKQIAAELGTSERTVKAHRAQVMEKMNVRSVAALVRVAIRLKDEAPVARH